MPQLLKDLLVSVRGGVPAVRAELFVVRIGGDTDLVPRAAQAQRLPEGHFGVRVKVPLPRSKYQLRIKPEPLEAPIIHIYIYVPICMHYILYVDIRRVLCMPGYMHVYTNMNGLVYMSKTRLKILGYMHAYACVRRIYMSISSPCVH